MQLKVSNLRKKINDKVIVDNVSLSINKKEIVGLLGPNGAGKTTTFYMIVGITRADSGTVALDDLDLTNAPIYKRSISGLGYLPQESSIFRKLSVYDNIYGILELRYKDSKYIEHRTEELIKEFGLSNVRNSRGILLSGGEKRRVEIARCLAINPEFILLDEPFTGIDPVSVRDIQDMIFNLRDRGIGVLITDHNVRETLKITERAYIMIDSRIVTEGNSETIINHEEVIDKYLGKNFNLK